MVRPQAQLRRALAAVLLLLLGPVALGAGCSRRKRGAAAGPAARAEVDAAVPGPPTQPFSAVLGGQRRSFGFGNAVVVDRGLAVHLTTHPVTCPANFTLEGYTVWLTIPVGPEGLYVGRTIDQHAYWRALLEEQNLLPRSLVSLRVDAVGAGRVRGHLTLRRDEASADSIDGDGDFDLAVCDPAPLAALLQPSRRGSAGPVTGSIAGAPFTLASAFLSQRCLVFSDNPAISCADLEPAARPASTAREPVGLSFQLCDHHRGISPTPRPAGGIYSLRTSGDGGSSVTISDMPVGFALTVERYDDAPGGQVTGTLRGLSSKPGRELDLGGSFTATICK